MINNIEIFEFAQCISALKQYRMVASSHIDKLEKSGFRTEEEISEMRVAVNNNADILEKIVEISPGAFGREEFMNLPQLNTEFDHSDLHQICASLKSAARDWTSIGFAEICETYCPIIDVIQKYISPNGTVFVPGSGLCRLPLEIANFGYRTITSESAFIMLVMTLVSFSCPNMFTIHPFIHSTAGLDKFSDCLISAPFSDYSHCMKCHMGGLNEDGCTCLNPQSLLENDLLILGAGKFESICKNVNCEYDCVVTCYFIDAVKDIKHTIKLIHQVLKDGGIWINMGPMVPHFQEDEMFPEFTIADIESIAQQNHLSLCENHKVQTSYAQNPLSHIKTTYNCDLRVYRK